MITTTVKKKADVCEEDNGSFGKEKKGRDRDKNEEIRWCKK
jgi:hypothetical protein